MIKKEQKISIRFIEKSEMITAMAREIAVSGVKPADSLHIACAIAARCDYMITVDNRLLKYRDNRIIICNPVDFIKRESENDK